MVNVDAGGGDTRAVAAGDAAAEYATTRGSLLRAGEARKHAFAGVWEEEGTEAGTGPPEWVRETGVPMWKEHGAVRAAHCPPSAVLIRGMQKSGTTWLEMQLAALANASAELFGEHGAAVVGSVRPTGLHVRTASQDPRKRCVFTIFERGPMNGQHKHTMDVVHKHRNCQNLLFREHNECIVRHESKKLQETLQRLGKPTENDQVGGVQQGHWWTFLFSKRKGHRTSKTSSAARHLRSSDDKGSIKAVSKSAASLRQGRCLPDCAWPPSYIKHQLFLPIFRDPRDVVISAHFFWGTDETTGDHNAGHPVSSAAKAGGALESRVKRAAMWHWFYVESGLVQHVLPVYYEDMRINQRAVLRRIAERLNIRVNDAVLDRVVRETSFDRMRELEDQSQLVGLSRPGKGTRRKVRCGGVGQWSAWPAERQQAAEKIIRRHGSPAQVTRYLDAARNQRLRGQIEVSEQALCEHNYSGSGGAADS